MNISLIVSPPQPDSNHKPVCSSGHQMIWSTQNHYSGKGAAACDVCDRDIDIEAGFWHCESCKIDLDEECGNIKIRQNV